MPYPAKSLAQRMKPTTRQRRPSDRFQHMYKTPAWKRLRAEHLAENPYCVRCQSEGKPLGQCKANVVDHIQPHMGKDDLFFDPHNLQTLCRRHHSRKTCLEDGGFGNFPSEGPKAKPRQ